MRKLFPLLLLTAILYGGYQFFQHFQLDGLDKISVRPRPAGAQSSAWSDSSTIPVRNTPAIRIASFNIQVFGKAKLAKPEVMEILAETIRRFDLVAIQEIRDRADDILPRFIDLINSTGRRYSHVIGPRLGRTDSKEQYAFIFDTQTLEIDRNSVYTVGDPDDLIHRDPFVASFRARGAPPDQAFTFTLIDVHTDPDEVNTHHAGNEIDALAQVYRAVQNDGRGEDDIILLGDLNADERHFGLLKSLPNITWVISGVTTNTKGTHTYDNILFDRAATTEFTGRAGVFDLIRQFNLSQDQALQVSDHFPVWAEFSPYEGGHPAVATRQQPTAQ